MYVEILAYIYCNCLHSYYHFGLSNTGIQTGKPELKYPLLYVPVDELWKHECLFDKIYVTALLLIEHRGLEWVVSACLFSWWNSRLHALKCTCWYSYNYEIDEAQLMCFILLPVIMINLEL